MLPYFKCLSALALAAGLAHVAPKPSDHFDAISWAADYDSGLAAAKEQHKALLVVMVAGPRDGEC